MFCIYTLNRFKNGKEILGDHSKFNVIESNNTLQLINIRRADHEGDYVCQIKDSNQLWNLTFKVRSNYHQISFF